MSLVEVGGDRGQLRRLCGGLLKDQTNADKALLLCAAAIKQSNPASPKNWSSLKMRLQKACWEVPRVWYN